MTSTISAPKGYRPCCLNKTILLTYAAIQIYITSLTRTVVVYTSQVSLLSCLLLCLLQDSDGLVSQWQFLRLYYVL